MARGALGYVLTLPSPAMGSELPRFTSRNSRSPAWVRVSQSLWRAWHLGIRSTPALRHGAPVVLWRLFPPFLQKKRKAQEKAAAGGSQAWEAGSRAAKPSPGTNLKLNPGVLVSSL